MGPDLTSTEGKPSLVLFRGPRCSILTDPSFSLSMRASNRRDCRFKVDSDLLCSTTAWKTRWESACNLMMVPKMRIFRCLCRS